MPCSPAATANTAIPAPARRIASPQRAAAPVMPRDPATAKMRPQDPLCASNGRGKSIARARFRSKYSWRMVSSESSVGGRLMSSTTSRPAQAAPGQKKCPVLGRPKVTVTCAFIAASLTRPLSASTPLGTSMATTGSPESFTIEIKRSKGSRRAPFIPVPKRPSTTPSAKRRSRPNFSQSRSVCSV